MTEKRERTLESKAATLVLAAFLLVGLHQLGCGSGTVGLASVFGGGGGGSVGPDIDSFDVSPVRTQPERLRGVKESPALISFSLTSARAEIVLRFDVGSPSKDVADLIGRPPSEGSKILQLTDGRAVRQLTPSHEPYHFVWDFNLDPNFPVPEPGTSSLSSPLEKDDVLTRDVALTIVIDGLVQQGKIVDLGNDPPALFVDSVADREVQGIVEIDFTVADTSEDPVSVSVFYHPEVDDPAQSGSPATGGVVMEDGQPTRFFWDVITDLGFTELPVRLAIIPNDGTVDGAPGFDFVRVDNNGIATASIDSAALILNADERRGIPIPVTVFDGDLSTGEPGDDVQVLVQWRRPSQRSFPELPRFDGSEDVRRFLQVPEFSEDRRERQVISERPAVAGGRLQPVDDRSVLLPELGGLASILLREDRTGQKHLIGTLDVLRRSRVPRAVKPTWSSNPGLDRLVAALPFKNGAEALVLQNVDDGFRLRRVRLSDGKSFPDEVEGAGTATAMTFEPARESVLVSVLQEGTRVWQVLRVDLRSKSQGAIPLVRAMGDTQMGRIRSIASMGRSSAIATVGSSLLRLDYAPDHVPRARALLGPPDSPLCFPWGVAVSPKCIYVAEKGADRIIAMDRTTGSSKVVLAKGIGFVSPEAIALENHGTRLLVVTETEESVRTIRGVELSGGADADGDELADAEVFELPGDYVGRVGSLSAGPDGVRLLTLIDLCDLAIGGGTVESRDLGREDSVFDLGTRALQLERPFEATLSHGQGYRIRASRSVVLAEPDGASGQLVWNTNELAPAGPVLLRAIPFDAESGQPSETVPKMVRHAMDTIPVTLGGASTTFGPEKTVIADLDSDGDLDLVTANSSGDRLTVFYQTNLGVFQEPPLILETPEFPVSLVAGDLDRDGDLDLVSANANGCSVSIYYQCGPQSFVSGPVLSTAAPVSVDVGDLDSDGNPDLVCANFTRSKLTVFLQKTPGEFSEDPNLLPDVLAEGPARVRVADLTGSGRSDVVVLREREDRLALMIQADSGAFQRKEPSGQLLSEPGAIDIGDVDGDGDCDLVVAGGKAGVITAFIQHEPGDFRGGEIVAAQVPGRPVDIGLRDFNGDSRLDIALASEQEDRLEIFFQAPNGRFDSGSVVLARNSAAPRSLAIADLNADGRPDLATASFLGNRILLFFQTTGATFDDQALSLGSEDITRRPRKIAIADLDGDRSLDLLVATENRGIALFPQARPGVFDGESRILPGTQNGAWSSILSYDLNGDGLLDVAATRSAASELVVLLQSTDGGFELQTIGSGILTGPEDVARGDLDGDGDADLVVANRRGNNLSVFLQVSVGVFEADLDALPTVETKGVVDVEAVDLDSDGDVDLISCNQQSNNLTLFLREGDRFNVRTLGNQTVTPMPSSLAVGDLNNDGQLDIACTSFSEGAVILFYQTTSDSFDVSTVRPSDRDLFRNPSSVALSDLDVDGDLDLVIASQGSNNLSVFRQEGPGVFQRNPRILRMPSSGPSQVTIADLDGDGDSDLVSANTGSHGLGIFFGGRGR